MSGERLIDSIVAATLKATGADSPKGSSVPLHEPVFRGKEWTYLKECVDTGWVSSVGKFVDRFEADLAKLMGAKRAVAIVNGTAALQLGLELVGTKRDEEVLMPALTFVATANAASHLGAVPHFIDSSDETLGVDPVKLSAHLKTTSERRGQGFFNRKTGRRLSAVVVMHTFGHPVDLDAVAAVCAEFGLPLVEDAAESLGTQYRGKPVGRHGRVSALSFNGNKIVTTGGGGALVTDDEALADRAKHLSTTAKAKHAWEFFHDEVGYNFRLPNLNAALGCAQLELLPSFLERKRELARRYFDAFEGVKGCRMFREPSFARSNYWLNTLILESADQALRDRVLQGANEAGLGARPVWKLMHRLPMYRECPRASLDTAERLEKTLINLPSGSALGEGYAG